MRLSHGQTALVSGAVTGLCRCRAAPRLSPDPQLSPIRACSRRGRRGAGAAAAAAGRPGHHSPPYSVSRVFRAATPAKRNGRNPQEMLKKSGGRTAAETRTGHHTRSFHEPTTERGNGWSNRQLLPFARLPAAEPPTPGSRARTVTALWLWDVDARPARGRCRLKEPCGTHTHGHTHGQLQRASVDVSAQRGSNKH